MIELNAANFLYATAIINRAIVFLRKNAADLSTEIGPGKFREDLVKYLNDFIVQAGILGCSVSVRGAQRALEDFRKPNVTYREILNRIEYADRALQDELEGARVFVPTKEKCKYLDSVDLFGEPVRDYYQSAIYEIDEAGKCLALARPTASVFHLMRAIEVGLNAVRKHLRVPEPTSPPKNNWGIQLNQIRDKIRGLNGKEADYFNGVAASLDSIKGAWRNPTMHVENKYTDDEAEHIFALVKGFMVMIASRFDENGDPV